MYSGTIHNLVGFLMMKNLVTLDPTMEFNVSSMKIWRPVVVHKDTNLMDMLKLFQVDPYIKPSPGSPIPYKRCDESLTL